jgi:hypothetical protein
LPRIISQSSAGSRFSIASVTGLKLVSAPATLIPVRPAAPTGAAGAALASAVRKESAIVPVAMPPIAAAEADVSSLAPGVAPFASSRNAARFT